MLVWKTDVYFDDKLSYSISGYFYDIDFQAVNKLISYLYLHVVLTVCVLLLTAVLNLYETFV